MDNKTDELGSGMGERGKREEEEGVSERDGPRRVLVFLSRINLPPVGWAAPRSLLLSTSSVV